MWIFSIVSIVMGIFLIFLGGIIRRYKMFELLAGYDPNKVLDKEGLANWTGVNLILMGCLTILIGILAYLLPVLNGLPYIIGFVIIILIMSIRTAIGCKKYEK